MSIIETKKLTRVFNEYAAVNGLDFNIEARETFALLGTNGAGKSTVIKMLTTLLPPTSGEAYIGGFHLVKESEKIRRIIGYVPQMLSVDGSMTGIEHLMLFAKLYDIPSKECKPRVMELLDFMGLTADAKKPVRTYSGGMTRKLEIAQSILHRPSVLFLDEPTVGLDPVARKAVWDHIIQLREQYKTTILLTTHLMDEADGLCNRIAFMSHGKLVSSGTPQELKDSIHKEGSTLEDVFIHYTADLPPQETASTERSDIHNVSKPTAL